MRNWNWPLIGGTILSLLIWVFLGWFIFGCGPDSSTETWPPDLYVAGIPVSGMVLDDEREALGSLAAAIEGVLGGLPGYIPTVLFIRSPSQRIPQICKNGACTSVWSEVPDVIGVKERVAGEGLSGLRRGGMIFVSRIGDRASMLDELLEHEMAHALCDCGDGAEVKMLEGRLMEGMLSQCDRIIRTPQRQ